MKLNPCKRWQDVIVAPSGTLRAVYDGFDLGQKGRLQEFDRENNRWINTGYYADYPELMLAFFNVVKKAEYGKSFQYEYVQYV